MKVLNIFLLALVLGLSSCVAVVDTPLEHTTYDMGLTASYHIRPYKIKLLDIQDGILSFDMVAEVELSNQTNRPMSYDIKCGFFNGNTLLKEKLVKDYRVPPFKNRLIRMVYHTRNHSVNGYIAKCRVKIYRLR